MNLDASPDLVARQPDRATRLLLLFHGVGSGAADLLPLGRALGERIADALIVSVQAPQAAGPGWQWFSVQGVTEASRPERVAAAMPLFVQAVQRWQAASGIDSAATTLIGFSQGAIMALESTQRPGPPLAGRVVAIAGRYAQPPREAPQDTRIHLLHGEVDPVMPVQLAIDAARRLQAMGASVSLDRFAGLGHGIDGRVLARLVQRLEEAGGSGVPSPG